MDVLIFLNTLVDYFLLVTTAKILGYKTGTVRTVLAAFSGGLSSLYIYLPKQKSIAEFLFKMAVAFLLCIICFKWGGIKKYLKTTMLFLGISCGYGGIMFALWFVFKPQGMVINNSVVYFSISTLQLVLFSVICYIVFSLVYKIFKKSSPLARRCKITVFADDKQVSLNAIADTGNSIEDIFGGSDIIIADKSKVSLLFGSLSSVENGPNAARYRVIPCNTVSGDGVLEGFRTDKAEIYAENKQITLNKPILAVSKTPLKEDYNAIINPNILR